MYSTFELKSVRLFLCAILLLITNLSEAQKGLWKPVAVDQHVTVSFPSKPDEMDVPATMAAQGAASAKSPRTHASRAFRHEDACGVYALVCVPLFEEPQLPPTQPARENYYKSHTIPLFISHARGQLLDQKISTIAGVDVITLRYRALGPTGSPTVKFFRQIVVGRMIYQFYFAPTDKTGNRCEAQRLRFFDSIQIKK